MGIVRDLYYARKMSAGLKLPAPTVALLIKRLRLAAAMGGGVEKTVSGTMVHITDALAKAALSVLASIEPIQDLHGYANPWPGGGGKNKLNNKGVSATVSNVAYTVQSDGSVQTSGTSNGWNKLNLGNQTLPAGEYIMSSGVSANYWYNQFLTATINGTTYETNNGNVTFTLTAETTFAVGIVTRPGSAPNQTVYPMIRLSSVTDETFAPYSNICPITGRTGVSVYRTGKNLFEVNSAIAGTTNGCTISVASDGTITVSGTPSANVSKAIHPSAFSGIGSLVMSISGVPSGIRIYCKKVGDSTSYPTLSNGSILETDTYAYNTFVLEVNTTYNGTATDIRVQVEKGSTATTYEPYNGNTYAVDWTSEAGTVYGGTLDVVTGVLTVDRVCETITKDSAWSNFYTGTGNSSAGVYLQYYKNCKYVDGAASSNGAICSTGKEVPNYWVGPRQNESPGNLDMCFAYSNTGLLRFHRTDVANITDLNAFKAAFPDTQICYYLATPLTYQLTPQEVQMLLGENYVWSSSGDTVSVTYYAEGNANPLQALNILLGGNYSNPKTADDVSDKEALEIILGGNK